ncbi:hypothetical protein JQS43_00870 [Natronosporangium hydrolyticum]|uniref:Uncharacterized protein n=1 Tax=Natronosporangium hydrolyticum TaxID=2811111 RepID=A0A895YHI7_9ACTN|nr:hypothetical protein [Natronosporangium hydrolyticum]QSB14979.1 hypothetical protein JQS43_00870 [Natronosporangium hydrolyticum]
MTDSVEFPPTTFAALAAPAVDRAFVSGIRAPGPKGRDVVMAHGGAAAGFLIDLRNPLAAGRRLSRDELAALNRYRDPAAFHEGLAASVAHGLLTEAPDGTVAATVPGHAFLRDLFALHREALTAQWGGQEARIDRLNGALARTLAAAAQTGGIAWRAQAPPYETDQTPPAVRLLNRLSTLRWHRADAHAAAWQAAGLTADEMVALPPGPARDQIEQETNARNAAPFAALSAAERVTMLADLAALP